MTPVKVRLNRNESLEQLKKKTTELVKMWPDKKVDNIYIFDEKQKEVVKARDTKNSTFYTQNDEDGVSEASPKNKAIK